MDFRARRRRGLLGQAAIELALLMSLLVTLAVASYDIGRAFSISESVDGMVRSGARVGIEQDIPLSDSACQGANPQLNCSNVDSGLGGQSDSDIGNAIRQEAASSLNLNWGIAGCSGAGGGPGGPNICPGGQAKDPNRNVDDYCYSGAGSGRYCGDKGGCLSSSSFWTVGVNACFAVRVCYYQAGTCISYSDWGDRPSCTPPGLPPNIQQCWEVSPPPGGPPGTFAALDVRVVIKFSTVTPFAANIVGNNGFIYLTRDAIGLPLY